MLEHTLPEEEHSQIVQTIEMFEAITQTQPDDYQSLEILKEAYQKVGRAADSLKTSRRLTEAYFNVGSYTLAMQECEVILLKEPNAPEILAMLGDIETRLQAAGHAIATTGSKNGLTPSGVGGVNGLTYNRSQDGGLVALQGRGGQLPEDRGDDHLAKFLVMQQLFPEEEVTTALETTKQLNKDLGAIARGFAPGQNLREETAKLDAALSGLIDRTKFAYVPLEMLTWTDRPHGCCRTI